MIMISNTFSMYHYLAVCTIFWNYVQLSVYVCVFTIIWMYVQLSESTYNYLYLYVYIQLSECMYSYLYVYVQLSGCVYNYLTVIITKILTTLISKLRWYQNFAAFIFMGDWRICEDSDYVGNGDDFINFFVFSFFRKCF